MSSHYFSYCDYCERQVVICGTCKNNTCNGGYGEVMGPEPGTTMSCPDCPSAYELDQNTPQPDSTKEDSDKKGGSAPIKVRSDALPDGRFAIIYYFEDRKMFRVEAFEGAYCAEITETDSETQANREFDTFMSPKES